MTTTITATLPFSRRICWLLLLLLLCAVTTTMTASSDPESDFGSYMEDMAARERDEWVYRAKLDAHEEWRQTTWSGWLVRTVQSVVYRFEPFFRAVADTLEETGRSRSSTTEILLYVGVRMVVVIGLLATLYVGAKVIQVIIGNGDLEVVEEIIIVHEHETEAEAAKARAGTTRGKKQKSS
jgi:hypothetical protein